MQIGTTQISLDSLLFVENQVDLIFLGDDSTRLSGFPTTVLGPNGFTEHDIELAIQEHGFQYHAYTLPATGFAVVIPIDWQVPSEHRHSVFYPLRFQERSDIVIKSDAHELSELEQVAFLRSLVLTLLSSSPANAKVTIFHLSIPQ